MEFLMLDVRPRVRVAQTASPGDVVEIRTLVTHPMHTGFATGADGETIPRHIIERFTCTFNGETVVDIDIAPGLAANPFIEFDARVPESGVFEFTWHDQDGSVHTETSAIEVG